MEAGTRTSARIRLASVSVVVARWFKDLLVVVFFLLLGPFILLLMIINILVEFSQKKQILRKLLRIIEGKDGFIYVPS
jgi:hypothetical protein